MFKWTKKWGGTLPGHLRRQVEARAITAALRLTNGNTQPTQIEATRILFRRAQMKSIVFLLLSLAMLICCCTRSKNQSQADRLAASNDIKVMLGALSDSVRTNGLAGWIPFLDSSKQCRWVFQGSTISYDSLIARLRRVDQSFRSSALGWDSVHVESRAENEATLFAICTETAIDLSGGQVTTPLEINAKLHKINGAWRFHSSEISEYDPWHASQNLAVSDTSRWLAQHIDSLIEASLGHSYHSGSILDVDDRIANASYRVYQMMGYFFEDPRHQLEHSYIVAVYSCDESGYTVHDSASVAIVRENRLIWRSKPLIRNAGFAPLPGFGDFNNDGTTDILFSTPIDMRGYGEALWILSPDSLGGRLLNAVDEEGQSTIVGATGTFKFTQPTQGAAKVIKANDFSGELNGIFVYTWNGSAFVEAKSAKARSRH